MIDSRCSKCGSERIECVGVHAYAIAIDDSVEVALMWCRDCDFEWEE